MGLVLQESPPPPPRLSLTLSDYPAIAPRKSSETAYLRPRVQLIQQLYIKTGAELSKLIGAGNASNINVLGRERASKDNPINELV